MNVCSRELNSVSGLKMKVFRPLESEEALLVGGFLRKPLMSAEAEFNSELFGTIQS